MTTRMISSFFKDFHLSSALTGALVGALLVYIALDRSEPPQEPQKLQAAAAKTSQPGSAKSPAQKTGDSLQALSLAAKKTTGPKKITPGQPAGARQNPVAGLKAGSKKNEELTGGSSDRAPAKTDRSTARMNFSALEKPGTIAATMAQTERRDRAYEEVTRNLAIASGDTLMAVLLKAGADRRQAHGAIAALTEVYDPRDLRPGQQLQLTFRAAPFDAYAADFENDSRPQTLTKLIIEPSPERTVIASLGDDGYQTEDIVAKLETRIIRAHGRIDDSLFLSAERAHVPPGIIIDVIHLYSFDVDFQRDIQPGDKFEVLYESQYTEDGQFVRLGEVKYAQLTLSKVALPLYWFKFKNDDVDYFNDKGESVRKALMKTPVDGARLSSRFGRRKHPILGYTKVHRGVDFAAPRGTPIMAAGSGTIEYAARNGGYGKYVRIRHNSEYKTAYGHMTRIAKRSRKGARVKQGQIIGWVGSTGRSTGPHLHYEILRKGRQINPLGLKLPTGRKLSGPDLVAFKKLRSATYLKFQKSAQKAQPKPPKPATVSAAQ